MYTVFPVSRILIMPVRNRNMTASVIASIILVMVLVALPVVVLAIAVFHANLKHNPKPYQVL